MKVPFRVVVRLVLGGILLVAGAMKIGEAAVFFSDLLGYRLPLPEIFLRWVAIGLPWVEVVLGLGLIFNFWPETIRPLVCALWLIFVLLLGQAVARGLDLDCGCFGAGGHGWFERPDVALLRAVIFLAASLDLAACPTNGSVHLPGQKNG
jgi:putative oxidoreductase